MKAKALTAMAVLAIVALGALSKSENAAAANGFCNNVYSDSSYDYFRCTYFGNNAPPNTRLFFDSGGNNNRPWYYNSVFDGYSGTVAAKCAHILRASDGAQYTLACGTGSPGDYTPVGFRPGYVFITHGANGPRNLGGDAYHTAHIAGNPVSHPIQSSSNERTAH